MDKSKVISVLKDLENLGDRKMNTITTTGEMRIVMTEWFEFIKNNINVVHPSSFKIDLETKDGSKYWGVWPCEWRFDKFSLTWDAAEYS